MHRRLIFWIIVIFGGASGFYGIATWHSSRIARFNWFQQNYKQIEHQLGVRFGTPYVLIDGKWKEVLAIEGIDKASPFYTAGAEPGDIISTKENHIDAVIHKWLYDKQGRSTKLILRKGGNGPPIDERSRKTITIEVPHLELDVDGQP